MKPQQCRHQTTARRCRENHERRRMIICDQRNQCTKCTTLFDISVLLTYKYITYIILITGISSERGRPLTGKPKPMEHSMYVVLNQILGLTFAKIETLGDEIIFRTHNNRVFRMYHEQDCCEAVWIEDIAGDLNDLVGMPLVCAEERTQDDPNACESGTWTFYEFATIKGSVTIRWYGSSNGYYSESVLLVEME